MSSDLFEADVALVGDFRFPGGTSTAIVSEIEALSDAGYRIALVAYASGFLSKTRAFHPEIAAQIAAGRAHLVAPGQGVKARLACLHHPAVFQNLPAMPLRLSVEQAVMVVHHPPLDPYGAPQYDMSAIRQVLQSIIPPRVLWAPVGPKARAPFQSLRDRLPLTDKDWVNVLNPDDYGGARPGLLGGKPVVGRHSRPDSLKWPDTPAQMKAAYPDTPDIAVRLMGFGAASVDGLEVFPSNWEVLDFGAMAPGAFLNSIDFLSYFHSAGWSEAFGRSILEAMASGVVCLLPKDFEPLFGEGAVYCTSEEVAETVRSFKNDPEAYARQSEAAVAVVRELFGPSVAVERLQALIGPPAEHGAAPPTLSAQRKPRVLYFTSNGIGMGHLTRVLACARRHKEKAEPIVVSMSRAYSVARHEGIMAEFIPFFRSSGMEEKQWQWNLRAELIEMFRFYRPGVVVLDGNVPYSGLLAALAEFPEIWSIWLRRAMWPPGVGGHFLKHHKEFDAVVEPGEIAGMLDRGLTQETRHTARVVAPIGYLREDEALDQATARSVLGLDPKRPAVFLQLGSGNNIQLNALRAMLIEKLSTDIQGEVPQIVVGEWQIGRRKGNLPDNVTVLRSFPFARFLNAFDYSIAMAGYNTFHENIRAGLPTLFLANEHPEQDEQWLRADFARVRGCALAARTENRYDILRMTFELSNPQVQARLRQACTRLPNQNGADEVASYLTHLAYSRRPHQAMPPK